MLIVEETDDIEMNDIEEYWQELPDDIDDEDGIDFVENIDNALKSEVECAEERWRATSCNTNKRNCGT